MIILEYSDGEEVEEEKPLESRPWASETQEETVNVFDNKYIKGNSQYDNKRQDSDQNAIHKKKEGIWVGIYVINQICF